VLLAFSNLSHSCILQRSIRHCSILQGSGAAAGPWRTQLQLLFVETTAFTKRIVKLGLEAELREVQAELLKNPDAGDTDSGTGGLRKIRMPDSTRRKGI
jgi:hypothetical protein